MAYIFKRINLIAPALMVAVIGVILGQPHFSDTAKSEITVGAASKFTWGSRSRVELRKNNNHFEGQGKINGNPVTFFVDTGATNIVIPLKVAQSIGLLNNAKKYKVQKSITGNGLIETYGIMVKSLSVGKLQVKNIEVYINPSDKEHTKVLLGMEFLKRFKVTMYQNKMVIKRTR